MSKTKEKSFKEKETEQRRGKRRYIERLIEDKEAQQRLEEFLDHPESNEGDYEDKQANRPFS